MKKSELRKLIRESIRETHNNPFISSDNSIQEGPMGAAKKCGRCLDDGKCCHISGTSNDPQVDCVDCAPPRIDMDKGF